MRYLRNAIDVLDGIVAEELDSIRSAADLCATAIGGGGLVHVFGTGHSHILAEELFYRAGGLAAVNPILVDRLMLHLERDRQHPAGAARGDGGGRPGRTRLEPGDAMIVASNSGGNAVCDVVAVGAKRAGVGVIAVVSRAHAASVTRGAAGSAGLLDVADVVIDNRGAVGDASIVIDGVDHAVGATSTVAGAAIVNAITAETAELLSGRGFPPDVLASSNVIGGDEHNEAVLAPFRERVRSL